jgi:hypothetical protein
LVALFLASFVVDLARRREVVGQVSNLPRSGAFARQVKNLLHAGNGRRNE